MKPKTEHSMENSAAQTTEQRTEPTIRLESSWLAVLNEEFKKPAMRDLREFLKGELAAGRTVYPRRSLIFNALNSTPFEKVKVVILGQDPYHGPNQAHGLSFSVPEPVPLPPSLRNIFKELQTDLAVSAPTHGNLDHWAQQGVLLLNATLTVEAGKAGSHQKKGWEAFTDRIIQELNARRTHLVFILWGSYAQKKGAFIDRDRHLVLEAVHPSPLSSHRGFFGSRPFSKTNAYLQKNNIPPIQWV